MTKYNINILEIASYLETHQPSTLELSMTEEQLFRQKNPLWARGYTRHDLMTIVYLYQMIVRNILQTTMTRFVIFYMQITKKSVNGRDSKNS